MNEFHNSALSQVRVLVQYMTSDKAIQREVEASLGKTIHLSVISRLRAIHYRRIKNAPRDFDSSVVWMDERHANNMDAANRNFVAAIMLARAA